MTRICGVRMIHPVGEWPVETVDHCTLPKHHEVQIEDSNHVDSHGCFAPVLIHQSTLREVRHVSREWPDGIHTCAELQQTEPGRRPCTCGRCPAYEGGRLCESEAASADPHNNLQRIHREALDRLYAPSFDFIRGWQEVMLTDPLPEGAKGEMFYPRRRRTWTVYIKGYPVVTVYGKVVKL